MTSLRFLDTNILLYSLSRDPTETRKRDRAIALIDTGNNALSVQVLQEFYVQATRPSRPDPLPHYIAVGTHSRLAALRGARDLRVDYDWRIANQGGT